MDQVEYKTRSLGLLSLKPCVQPRCHSFASNFMKLDQNICFDDILVKSKCGSCEVGGGGSKTRSLGQILLKSFVQSRSHSFVSFFM